MFDPNSSDHPFRQSAVDLQALPTDVATRLTKLPEIRSVIFDIYGTLLISGWRDTGSAEPQRHEKALADALEACGFRQPADPPVAMQQYREMMRACHQGLAVRGKKYGEVDKLAIWREWFSKLKIVPGAAIPVDRLKQFAIEYEARANPSRVMPHAIDTIRILHERGCLLGIVSNAQFFTHDLLHITLGEGAVELLSGDLCFFSYRYAQSKPGAEMFDRLVNELNRRGIRPHQALYVGNDMLNDVTTASRAGLRTALFAGDARSLRTRQGDPRVKGFQADVVLTSLDQLQACVA